ncbi:hypothetical protein [Pseudomonas sp. Marseille-QA0892]
MGKNGLILLAAFLSGCSLGIPSTAYIEPPDGHDIARVRIITNSTVFGDSLNGNCAPAERHKMAEAGRFSRDGRNNINYPQFPAVGETKALGMPKRVMPKLAEYIGAVRMGEGSYKELVTEYRVRTDAPFQLATLGAAMGSYGSTYYTCPGEAKIYKLEPGKDYEIVVGPAIKSNVDGTATTGCMFGMFEYVTLSNSGETPIVVPKIMAGTPAPQNMCNQ